jgi:poly-gamma-glutamate capsule biosynthesis protein CapA/YwtB (metallophosphatase superfamily)
MATEQDTSNQDASLRPQTPAARRRNPGAHHRTPEERERLREESRARRHARENGHVVAPEPTGDQITVRRLSEPEANPDASSAPPSPAAAPRASPTPPVPSTAVPPATSLKPSTPAGGAVRDEAAEAARDGAEALRENEAAEAARDEAEALREDDGAEAHRDRTASAALLDAPTPAPAALREDSDGAAPPPARPAGPALPPAAPRSRRERAAALLGLASAVGVAVALAASLGSGGLPGFGGGIRGELSSRAVAPGGWLTLTGSHAPEGRDLVLESRSGDGPWHAFAHASADDDGHFAVKGRVLQRPGRIEVRGSVPGGGTTKPVAVTVRPLRLAAVGDINLGDQPGDAIAANGPTYPWQGAGKALRHADITFGNLECAVSTRGEPFPKEYNFRATPAALAGLRRNSGIDVLNLANNHVGDYGPVATTDTVRGVERLGMKAVGAGPDLERALAPQVVQRLGLKVAFVGFSEIAPIEFAAAPGRPGTAWARPDQIAQAVHAARRKADIVVATFHWGIEKQTLESARQRELADVAVRAGAQVVIGAHPHTLQPVRRQGAAIVAYSLGNFVFGAQSPETTTTGILELDLTAEGVAKGNWRAGRIEGGRPLLDKQAPRRLPMRDDLRMEAGVNLPEL